MNTLLLFFEWMEIQIPWEFIYQLNYDIISSISCLFVQYPLIYTDGDCISLHNQTIPLTC